MKVIVTGGAGYIGSHTCKALSQGGFTPIVFDNFSKGEREFVKWGPVFEGDLCKIDDLREAFLHHSPQAVLHFAGLTSVPDSVNDPTEYFQVNVAGSLNLFEVMQDFGVKQIVFSSSASIYGEPPSSGVVQETHKGNPLNPYGRSKLMIEEVLSDLANAGVLSSTSLRYFNASGADLNSELGESISKPSHLIPIVLSNVMVSKRPTEVFGADYSTEDGTCVRDYIHVADLAAAHVLALQKQVSDTFLRSRIYNLGTGRGYSVIDVIKAVEAVMGIKVDHFISSRRAGGPSCLIADSKLAQQTLGWKPQYSDLKTIVESNVRWVKRKLNQL